MSTPSIASSSSNTTISPEIKAKLCNPSNPSLKVVNTTEARICGIPKTVGPALASSSSSSAPPPKPTTSSPSVAPLAQSSSKNTGSSNNTSSGLTTTTTTTNVPIVLRPLPGGTCPTGYHLVSATVCIKDIPSSAQQQTTSAALIPTRTANSTKSLPITSSPAATQPSHASPIKNDNKNTAANSNNEENFHTKILKSFNKKLK